MEAEIHIHYLETLPNHSIQTFEIPITKHCEDCAILRQTLFGRGDDTVGDPHRAQISQFELFELSILSELDKQFPVEQFEATVSQSTVPSPPFL